MTTAAAPTGEVTPVGDRLLVTGLRPGTDALVEVDTADGGRVGLLVLDAGDGPYRLPGPGLGCRAAGAVRGGVVFDPRDEVRLHGSGRRRRSPYCPHPERAPVVDGVRRRRSRRAFVRYTVGGEGDGRRGLRRRGR